MSAWQQIVVVGAEKPLRAFLAGFAAGRGVRDCVLLGHDVGVGAASLSERVRDLLAAGSHHVLLAPEGIAAPLAAALGELGEDVGLRLESSAVVRSAAMSFAAEVFSEELAARVRSDLRDALPPGVALEGYGEEEHREPDARGAELYAPEHAFTFRASGRLVGPLPGVIEMRRRARRLEFVTVEAIALEVEPAPGT
jgi:hypothetical protein